MPSVDGFGLGCKTLAVPQERFNNITDNIMATLLRFDLTLPTGAPLCFDTPGAHWDGTVEEVLAANAPQDHHMNNKISATLSEADKTTALQKYQDLRTLLSFLQTLTPEQKKRINNAANGRLPFSQQACQYAQQFPAVLPGNFQLAEFTKDITFLSAFVAVVNADDNLHQKIHDTFALANSDAYDQALKVYNFFKAANFNGEYTDVVNKLGSYFKGQGAAATAAKAAKAAKTTPKA